MDFTHSGKGARRRWSDLPPKTRRGLGMVALVQLALLVSAAIDLARRPADQVRGGRKWAWFPVLLVNFVGPITYFLVGRVRPRQRFEPSLHL